MMYVSWSNWYLPGENNSDWKGSSLEVNRLVMDTDAIAKCLELSEHNKCYVDIAIKNSGTLQALGSLTNWEW